MTQQAHIITFGGGLDLVTPAMRRPEGAVIASENYEPRPEGYKRIHGIERFDGRPQPHKASYWYLNFDAGAAAISEGDTVTGVTSGATGKALTDAVVSSGAYGTGDAVGYLTLSEVTGTFQDNEDLQVSAATKSVSNGLASEKGAPTDALSATLLQDSIETRRALIGAVTGSGAMRGTWRYNGVVYAFRDNAGATAVDMWKSTSAGWVQCVLGSRISFTAGTTEFLETETLTGGTSTATATINRVIVQSGDWSTNDAVGYLVIGTVTGGPYQAETGTSASGSATLSGAETANTLAAGGSFEFLNYNFLGSSGSEKMYGVDGVSLGFEWDGTIFTPIITGMTTDTPTHVIAHKKHLFYMFAGGSVQHGGIGAPYVWSVITGASEIGLGDEGTGFIVAFGALVMYGQNSTHILYGNDSTDWAMETLSEEAGAYPKTVQNVGSLNIHMDRAGVRDLRATKNYGDFTLGNLSVKVDPWFETMRTAGQVVTATTRVKAKNQYRIFYDNNVGAILDLTTGKPQFLLISYGMVVRCASSGEDSDGTEWNLFGSDDGYVYRAEVGTSLDGSALTSFLRLPFNNLKAPRLEKRLHSVEAELEAAPSTSLTVAADFGYGNADLPSQASTSLVDTLLSAKGGGGFWSEAYWSEFYWGSQVEGQAKAHISGLGENVSLVFASTATYEDPHTLHGATVNYSLGKLRR